MRNGKLWERWLPFVLPVLFIVGWEVLARMVDNRIVLPSFTRVMGILLRPNENLISIGTLYKNTYVSLVRVFIGYFAAALVAIPLGIAIGYSKFANRLLSFFVNLFRPIPPLAWVPLVLAWFGIMSFATIFDIHVKDPNYLMLNGIKISMVFIIFMGAFFPILTNTTFGIRTVRQTLIDSARTLGATQGDIFKKVLIPAALPSIVTGMRVGLGVAWMCLISAEMLPGSISGVGYMITHAYQVTRIDIVIAGIIAISLVGAIFEFLFQWIDKRFFRWQKAGSDPD